MTKWIWIGLAASFAISALVLSLVGVNPKPIKIINPSQFQNIEDVGGAVFERLFKEFRENNILVVGSSPFDSSGYQIWMGLIDRAQSYGDNVDLLIEWDGLATLSSLVPDAERKVVTSVEQIFESLQEGKKTIIHVTSEHSHHSPLENLNKLLSQKSLPYWSLSQSQFILDPGAEGSMRSLCEGSSVYKDISCKSLKVSKKYYKKSYPRTSIFALVEKFGPSDYVVLLHRPFGR